MRAGVLTTWHDLALLARRGSSASTTLWPLKQKLVHPRERGDVVAGFGVDETCQFELLAVLLFKVEGEDRFVVGDPIAELADRGVQSVDLATPTIAVGKRAAQVRAPKVLVATAEKSAPEAEGERGDHASAGRRSALDREPLDRLVDAFAALVGQKVWVTQPDLGDADRERGVARGVRKLVIDGVAQEDLKVVENLEERGRNLGVPVIESDCAAVILPRSLKEGVKTGVADPRRNLVGAHENAVSAAREGHGRCYTSSRMPRFASACMRPGL